MKPWQYRVSAKADAPQNLEIAIYDVIGADFFGEGVTAEKVLDQLRANQNVKSIALRLNTVGGVMDEATAIYNLLAERQAAGVEVTAYVDGIAASAGGYLTTVASKVVMPANAFIMIHKARGGMRGTDADMESARAALAAYNDVIAEAFAAASARRGKGKTKADFLAEMNKGDRYVRADEAIAWGIADEKTAVMKAAACAVDLGELGDVPDDVTALFAVAQQEPPAAAPEEVPAVQTAIQPEPPAPQPSAAQEPEKPTMTQTNANNEPNLATPTVARALNLPAGATEADIVAAITRQRELELTLMTVTGCQLTAEAVGALRGIKAKADRCDALEVELTSVKAERDQQNFDALVMKGQSNPVKLTPATAKMYSDEFAAAKAEGRGSEVVARLKGFIDVAPTIHALSRPAGAQPRASGASSSPTTHNGKTYAELKPLERARLSQSEPELFRAMKTEHEASQASA